MGVLVVAGGGAAALLLAQPSSSGAGGAADNGTATSFATVQRRSLTSQMQTSATLGYADASTVMVPAGPAPSEVGQAEQAVSAAGTALRNAQAAVAEDGLTLEQAQSQLAADRAKQAIDCRGAAAAGSPSSAAAKSTRQGGAPSSSSESGASACATVSQAVTSDEAAVASAQQKVTADRAQLANAQTSLRGARESSAEAESGVTVYDTGAVYTRLPKPGDVIRRGGALYAINGRPVLLLYGGVPAWRAFRPGMEPGRDVAELKANLNALGVGHGLAGDAFDDAAEAAVKSLQTAKALPADGVLPLGAVVFEPAAVRVASVTPVAGAPVQPGAVLGITAVRHQVTIELDASDQSDVKQGDRVLITLPSNETTPGVVSSVGRVATSPPSSSSGGNSSGGSSNPTVEVDVRLLDERAAGRLDQAPVQVAITTASVERALVVPVDSLLALAGGGYAVETVDAAGDRRLQAVTLGLFDDADGLVQVRGSGLRAGQRIVVPAT